MVLVSCGSCKQDFIQLGRRLCPQRVNYCRKAFFKKKKVAVLKDKSKKVQFADVCWVEEEESVRCEAKGQRRLQ